MLKCSRGQERSPRSGSWPQAKTNKQSEWTVSLELDGGKTGGERWGGSDRYFNLKLFGATSNGFLCSIFLLKKSPYLMCTSISHNLMSNLNSDGI